MDYPYNLGSYTRKVTTISEDAQRWFDCGLNWCFGYHHEEAVACFTRALETDPNCAMAHWGVAYAAGPNYNFPWELQDPAGKAAALARAYDSARAALALVDRISAPERALIEALPARYPQRDPIDDQRPWNDAFADAMRLAHQAHPDDLDLRFIFAEAILNRTPWRMWDLRHITHPWLPWLSPFKAVSPKPFTNWMIRPRHPGVYFGRMDFENFHRHEGILGQYARGYSNPPDGAQWLCMIGGPTRDGTIDEGPVDWVWQMPGGGKLFVHNGDNIDLFCSDPRHRPNLFHDILNGLVFSGEPAETGSDVTPTLPGWLGDVEFRRRRRRNAFGHGRFAARKPGHCPGRPRRAAAAGDRRIAVARPLCRRSRRSENPRLGLARHRARPRRRVGDPYGAWSSWYACRAC